VNDDMSHSGSRWEPGTGEQRTDVLGVQPGGAPAGVPPQHPAAPGPADAGDRRGVGRGVLAGAGIALFVLGGVGGFAVGHSVGGTGQSTSGVVQPGTGTGTGGPGQGGFPGGGTGQSGDGDRPDFGGQPPAAGNGSTGSGTTGGGSA
jgi:hypothetical protein